MGLHHLGIQETELSFYVMDPSDKLLNKETLQITIKDTQLLYKLLINNRNGKGIMEIASMITNKNSK